MGPEPKEAVQQLMSRMDTDGDGAVQIEEWLAFMHKHGNGSLEVEEPQVHHHDSLSQFDPPNSLDPLVLVL